MKRFRAACIWMCMGLLSLAPNMSAQEAAVPAEFEYMGSYLFEKRVKLRHGEVFEVSMKPILYRVYTDGITVRIYGSEESYGHTSYEIYRSEGILEAPNRSTIETVAGIQAKSTNGSTLRSITLTRRELMITTHPAVAGVVEVVYSKRVSDGAQFGEQSQLSKRQ